MKINIIAHELCYKIIDIKELEIREMKSYDKN